MFDGQQSKAIESIEQAIRLSPYDKMLPAWLTTLSATNYLSGDYEAALEIAESAIQAEPAYPLALRNRASALAQLERLDEAREALEVFLRITPNHTVERGRAGMAFREEKVFQHYMEGLRKAGLPER